MKRGNLELYIEDWNEEKKIFENRRVVDFRKKISKISLEINCEFTSSAHISLSYEASEPFPFQFGKLYLISVKQFKEQDEIIFLGFLESWTLKLTGTLIHSEVKLVEALNYLKYFKDAERLAFVKPKKDIIERILNQVPFISCLVPQREYSEEDLTYPRLYESAENSLLKLLQIHITGSLIIIENGRYKLAPREKILSAERACTMLLSPNCELQRDEYGKVKGRERVSTIGRGSLSWSFDKSRLITRLRYSGFVIDPGIEEVPFYLSYGSLEEITCPSCGRCSERLVTNIPEGLFFEDFLEMPDALFFKAFWRDELDYKPALHAIKELHIINGIHKDVLIINPARNYKYDAIAFGNHSLFWHKKMKCRTSLNFSWNQNFHPFTQICIRRCVTCGAWVDVMILQYKEDEQAKADFLFQAKFETYPQRLVGGHSLWRAEESESIIEIVDKDAFQVAEDLLAWHKSNHEQNLFEKAKVFISTKKKEIFLARIIPRNGDLTMGGVAYYSLQRRRTIEVSSESLADIFKAPLSFLENEKNKDTEAVFQSLDDMRAEAQRELYRSLANSYSLETFDSRMTPGRPIYIGLDNLRKEVINKMSIESGEGDFRIAIETGPIPIASPLDDLQTWIHGQIDTSRREAFEKRKEYSHEIYLKFYDFLNLKSPSRRIQDLENQLFIYITPPGEDVVEYSYLE
jgi:hypothetical protein